jgi:ElaB/YqjD/DUF883 family membrane-anchored ribosome-binding protein
MAHGSQICSPIHVQPAEEFAMDTQPDNAGNGQFKELFDGVEDLIERVSAVPSPEVQKIRAKARVALSAAKSAARDSAAHLGRRARQMASTTDGYVRQSPWQAAALTALVGFVAGIAVSRRRSVG